MSTGTTTSTTYGDAASLAKFSVARYQRMIETGVLTPEDKVELLENYVVLKMPRNPPHDGTIDLMDEALRPFIPAGWRLRVQLSLVLLDSQPEPDFAVVRGSARSYVTRHPTAADAGIVIEVADSGGGIPVEDQPKIFEELYRGTNARSTEGSGLGLALVKRIIALHNGQIHVRSSQAEPRGTVFTIRLPVTRRG